MVETEAVLTRSCTTSTPTAGSILKVRTLGEIEAMGDQTQFGLRFCSKEVPDGVGYLLS